MSVKQDELLERYDENQRKAAEADKAAKALSLEVVSLLSASLRSQLDGWQKKIVHAHRPAADADFVKALTSSLDEVLEQKQALLLVTVGEGVGEGTFTLSGPPSLVEKASGGVATALNGRGGGKGGRYQGKCQKLGGATDAMAAAESALE